MYFYYIAHNLDIDGVLATVVVICFLNVFLLHCTQLLDSNYLLAARCDLLSKCIFTTLHTMVENMEREAAQL